MQGIQLFGGALTYKCDTGNEGVDSYGSGSLAGDITVCPPAISCGLNACVNTVGDGIGDGAAELSGIQTNLAGMKNLTTTGYDLAVGKFSLNWGYDNILFATMTGWIITTGDMW